MDAVDEELRRVVLAFLQAYARKDIEACVECTARQAPLLLVGTNVGELYRSPEDVRAGLARDFAAMSDILWGEPRHLQVSAGPAHAGAFVELPLQFTAEGKAQKVLFRQAMFLVREQGQWRIQAALASLPLPEGSYTAP